MSTTEVNTLDMSSILLQAYEVGDLIKSSAEVADYLYWKNLVETDPEVQALQKLFAKKKALFEECQRFGHFHPDYHAAKQAAEQVQKQLDSLEIVRNFKRAEEALDELLYEISTTIAHSVSETIKVPSNNPLPVGGCGGGNCSKCG